MIERITGRTGRVWATKYKDGWTVYTWTAMHEQGLSEDQARRAIERRDRTDGDGRARSDKLDA